MAVAKEQIRQIISENNISSVADVYMLLKDSFKDILQELMEAELDATEYSCAMKSHFRKFGNQMSGSGNHLCNYASLLA